MKKLILILLVLIAGGYGLSLAGKMPQEVYSRTLGFWVAVKGGTGPFDGTWVTSSSSQIKETEEAFCGTAAGKFIVQGTNFYGSVLNEYGDTFMVTAQVDNGGALSGGMARGSENIATFDGVLLDSDGTGSWKDQLGCFGDVKFSRITALGSHDAKYINSVAGRIFVVRGVRTIPAKAGTTLKVGDVVAVEEGSYAKLTLGDKSLIISEKTKFEIVEEYEKAPPPSFTSRIWTGLKNLIQGPSFEIKVPTATAGVRG